MTNNYTLRFIIKHAPKPIYVPPPEDKSSKGAKIKEMGITGKVGIELKEKMYLNLEKLRKPRQLQDDEANSTDSNTTGEGNSTGEASEGTNTTWIINIDPEVLPPIPEDLNNLEFPLDLIDDRVFDVYVDPSPYQDKTKINLTWSIASMDEKSFKF